MAKISTLTDNFNDNSIDSSKWNVSEPYDSISISETSNQIQMSIASDAGESDYADLYSHDSYDFTDSNIFIELVTPYDFFSFEVDTTDGGEAIWSYDYNSGSPLIYTKVLEDYSLVYDHSYTYSNSTYRWLRIREASDVIYFDYSSDGASWTNRGSYTTSSSDWTSVKVWFEPMSQSTGAHTIVMDNVNNTTSTTSTSTSTTTSTTTTTTTTSTSTSTSSTTSTSSSTSTTTTSTSTSTSSTTSTTTSTSTSSTTTTSTSSSTSTSTTTTYAFVEDLQDTFDDNSIDTNKWSTSSSQIAETNQELEFTSTTSSSYPEIQSAHSGYSLLGSYALVEVVDAGDQSITSYEAYPLQVIDNGDTSKGFKWIISGGNLRAYVDNSQEWSDTYSATNHKWLRIRESGGTVYFDYSSNNNSWTNAYSTSSSGATLTNMRVYMTVGTWQSETETTTMKVDNFNITTTTSTSTTTTTTTSTSTSTTSTSTSTSTTSTTSTSTSTSTTSTSTSTSSTTSSSTSTSSTTTTSTSTSSTTTTSTSTTSTSTSTSTSSTTSTTTSTSTSTSSTTSTSTSTTSTSTSTSTSSTTTTSTSTSTSTSTTTSTSTSSSTSTTTTTTLQVEEAPTQFYTDE